MVASLPYELCGGSRHQGQHASSLSAAIALPPGEIYPDWTVHSLGATWSPQELACTRTALKFPSGGMAYLGQRHDDGEHPARLLIR
jgi:hypothetical protein